MNDTICAISTSLGEGAISIIRVSGEDAITNVNKIFRGKDLLRVESHTINYGHIMDDNKVVDEVLVSVMKKPKTFTIESLRHFMLFMGPLSSMNRLVRSRGHNGHD